MAKRSNHAGPGNSSLEAAAIPHAVRCWEAEVENARRLSSRVQVLLSLATALLGLLFLRGGEISRVQEGAVRLAVAAVLVAASASILAALVILLRPRPRISRMPLSSHWLAWPARAGREAAELTVETARYIVWDRTIRASDSLRKANTAKQADVDRGQGLILVASGCTLGSLLVHVIWAKLG